MSQITGDVIKKDAQTLENNASDQLQVKIKSAGGLKKDASGISADISDSETSSTKLWSSSKTSNAISASIDTAISNALVGIARKAAVIDFITQAELDASSPNLGDRYVVTDGVNVNKIAEYDGAAWGYTVPVENWLVINSNDDTDYTYDPDLAAAFKWAVSGTKQAQKIKTETFTLDSTAITNKKVTLSNTPIAAGNVKVYLVGGIIQLNTIDYSVNLGTKEISWNGLGLESLLVEGKILIIDYPTYE
jgi:hypothetical protein